MFTKAFAKDAGERAVKAFASALLSVWVVGDKAFDLFNVNWQDSLGVGAAVASFLLSLVSYKAGTTGTASAVKEVTYTGDTRAL
jgi:hypothetical protein